MNKLIEQLKDIHQCMRALERKQQDEPDPRKRADMAQTLDMLEHSLDVIVDKLAREKEKAGAA